MRTRRRHSSPPPPLHDVECKSVRVSLSAMRTRRPDPAAMTRVSYSAASANPCASTRAVFDDEVPAGSSCRPQGGEERQAPSQTQLDSSVDPSRRHRSEPSA